MTTHWDHRHPTRLDPLDRALLACLAVIAAVFAVGIGILLAVGI